MIFFILMGEMWEGGIQKRKYEKMGIQSIKIALCMGFDVDDTWQ